MAILYEINKNYTSKSNKPKHDIIIEKIQVMENPFRKAIASLRAALESETKEAKEDKAEQQKARWIHDETEAFKIPEQKKEQKGEADGSQAKLKKLLHDYCFT